MHKQAAFNTLKVIFMALAAGIAVAVFIAILTMSQAIYLGCGALLAFAIYMFYNIEKDRLERLDQLNKSIDIKN